MFTIARVAEMLGENEEWLHELAGTRRAGHTVISA
jgi:hypothetical protein